MRFYSVVMIGLLSLGCGPTKPTADLEVNVIGLDDLVSTYRDTPKSRVYTGSLVQVRLKPKSYKCYLEENRIEACFFRPEKPGCVYFVCPSMPTGGSAHGLILTGRCRGIVRDGVQREVNTDFYILVEDCSVQILWE